MLGDTTEMKLDDWWRDLIPPDELAVQPPMMPEQPFNMNGNNSSNVTQQVNKDGKSLQAMNQYLMEQIKAKDEEIARLNNRLDKLIEIINKN